MGVIVPGREQPCGVYVKEHIYHKLAKLLHVADVCYNKAGSSGCRKS
jgi:hypothetical protein